MYARFCERIETALTRLQGRIERARKPIDRSVTERQIGRLLGRNSRAAARYAIRLVDDPTTPARLWKTLAQWQSRGGLGNSPRAILQELGAIQSTDIVLPTATVPQRELRPRCVVRPDRAQAVLLQRLGLCLPERLRPSIAAHQM